MRNSKWLVLCASVVKFPFREFRSTGLLDPFLQMEDNNALVGFDWPHAKRQTKAGIFVLDVPVRWLAVLRIPLHFFLLASRRSFV
jgi:hypothetical protein